MNANRHTNILDYALRSIRRRWTFHISVIVIFSIVVFIAASLLFTIKSLSVEAENILTFSPDLTVQYLAGGRQVPIPISISDEIERIPGVKDAGPRVWGYLYDNISGANYTIWGVRHEDITELVSKDLSFVEGSFWDSGECGKIVVGASLKDTIGLGDRRSLSLTGPSGETKNFTIVGILGLPSSLMTADMIFMSEDDVRDFFNFQDNLATDLIVDVANPSEVPMIAKKIFDLYPSCRVISKTQLTRTYEAVFGYRGGVVLFTWFGCLVAFLILLLNKGSIITPGERKELGILKALGWSTADIMEEKVFEAGMIALLSFSIGFIGAYLHVYVFGAVLLRPILFGWSVLYPDFRLVPVFEAGPIILIFIMTVVPYFAASVFPAWKSASFESDDLLRGGR
jgi:ABC-type lipoprotein release transport system permease subunit